MPRQRPPAGDGSAATQSCSPGAGPVPGQILGLQLGLGCQQEGLATQAQEGCHDLAITPRLSEPCYLHGREIGLKMTSEVSWS